MKYYKRILFPTDFSECADEAYEYALLIANMYNAELHILYAHKIFCNSFGQEFIIPQSPQITNSHPEEIDKEMEKYVPKYGIEDNKIIKSFDTGIAIAPTIVEYIETNKIDLVIMGTHGHRGFRHMLLGSITEEVLKISPCPVITIRKDDSIKPVPKHILVPIDYSDHSLLAFSEGYNIAQKFGADVTLLHVIEDPIPSAYYLAANELTIDHLYKKTAKNAKEKLSKICKEAGIIQNCNIKVIKGHVASSITKYASDNKMDLVIMGSHGYTGLTHFLLGSTAEKVLRSAHCPVMIVKQDK